MLPGCSLEAAWPSSYADNNCLHDATGEVICNLFLLTFRSLGKTATFRLFVEGLTLTASTTMGVSQSGEVPNPYVGG